MYKADNKYIDNEIMSVELPPNTHQKWLEFINELNQLAIVKERHIGWQHYEIAEGRGTDAMKKDIKGAEFKLKNYKSWSGKVAQALHDNQDLATQEPTTEDVNNKIFNGFGLSKSIMDRLNQFIGNGHIADLNKMTAEMAVNNSNNTSANAYTNTSSNTSRSSDSHISSDSANGANNSTSNSANSANNSSSNSASASNSASGTIDTTKIEAVPKNLAAEGARPGDDDPMGQRIYDLRLVTGFGPKQAEKMAGIGMTLEALLSDWEKVKAAGVDTLMIERMPIPAGYSESTFSKLTHQRQHALKYSEFQNRLSSYSKWLPKLNHHQLIGIKYFRDIAQKIPRAEIQRMERLLKAVAKRLDGGKNKIIVKCCGSYRRGRSRSGDIDCLMTHQDLATAEDVASYNSKHPNILHLMVNALAGETCKGFLTDHLTEGGDTKYMGVCLLPSRKNNSGKVVEEYTVHRRIDIRFVPYNSFGTALLYFTGSRDFNTQMRSAALKRGLTLSEYGLFKLVKDPKTKRWARGKSGGYTKGEQLPTPIEEDVFRILEMDYKTPQERDI